VIIVTGASSGIGPLAAKKLVKMGHHVILAARDANKLKEIEQQIKQYWKVIR